MTTTSAATARETTAEPDRSRADLRLLVALVLAGAVLVVLFPGVRRSLWLDESGTVLLAGEPWAVFVHALHTREGNMALYTLLMRPVVAVAHGEWALRSLSLACSVAALAVLTALGRTLLPRRAALLVPVLLATDPLFLRYAQEARGYTLVLLLVTVSGAALVAAVRTGRTGWWVTAAVAAGLAPYAHFFGALAVVGQVAALALAAPGTVRRRVVAVAAAIVVVLWLPLPLFVSSAGTNGVSWVGRSPVGRAVGHVGAAGVAAALAAVVLIAAGLLWRRARAGRAWPRSDTAFERALVVSWLVTPVVLAVVASVLVTPMTVPRYFLVCLPPFVLLVAAFLGRLRPFAVTAVLTAVVAVLGVLAGSRYVTKQTEDWRSAANVVATGARQGDAVLFVAPFGRVPFEHYLLQHPAAVTATVPAYPALPWGRAGIAPLETTPLPRAAVSSALTGHDRVWLVQSHARVYGTARPQYAGAAAALSAYHAARTWQLPGVLVVLYVRG